MNADVRDLDYLYNEANKALLAKEKADIINTRLAINGDLKTVKEHIYRIDLELAKLAGRGQEIINDNWAVLKKNAVKKKTKKKKDKNGF